MLMLAGDHELSISHQYAAAHELHLMQIVLKATNPMTMITFLDPAMMMMMSQTFI